MITSNENDVIPIRKPDLFSLFLFRCMYVLGFGKFLCSREGTFVLVIEFRGGVEGGRRRGGEGGVGCEYICMCVSEVENPRSPRDG